MMDTDIPLPIIRQSEIDEHLNDPIVQERLKRVQAKVNERALERAREYIGIIGNIALSYDLAPFERYQIKEILADYEINY